MFDLGKPVVLAASVAVLAACARSGSPVVDVAADGLHSPVRRRLGLDGPPARLRRFGLRRHFRLTPWTSFGSCGTRTRKCLVKRRSISSR